MWDDVATRYVTAGDGDVAYKVLGAGSFDVVYFFGLGSHVDQFFDDPATSSWIKGLSSFSRLIVFDRRGTGASDRVPHDAVPTWEEWADDTLAVLDAVGSERAVLFAGLDAGPIAMLVAALHPERVSALILTNTFARYLADEDYPIGASETELHALIRGVERLWGTEELSTYINPTLAKDREFTRENARRLRASATPRAAAAQYRYILERDVRPVLSTIQAPTLVLHTTHNPIFPLAHGRYLADHISGAKLVEVPGVGIGWDHGQTDTVLTEVAEFLTGQRPVFEVDRTLTTLLFSDIVASTEHLVAAGDRGWRATLDAHDRLVRDQVGRFGGREIKTTGDGFLASFDGPSRAARCAASIRESVRELGIELRIALHTGECEVRRGDLAGLAVHIAARVLDLAEPGEVLATDAFRSLVDESELTFTRQFEARLKGVPGTWKLYTVVV